MNEPLPRQTYKTAEHDEAEKKIASIFAAWTKSECLKIGSDPQDKQKARIDRAFFRDRTIVAFAEIKTCSYSFASERIPNGWIVGRDKIESARALFAVVRVPVLMIIQFGCGTVAFLDSQQPFEVIESFGRRDRNDPADIEVGARFQWQQFKRVP